MLAQAFAQAAKADELMEFNVYDIANGAANAAAELVTAVETKWTDIDAENPLFDEPEAEPSDGGDTTVGGSEGSDNTPSDSEGNDTEGAGT